MKARLAAAALALVTAALAAGCGAAPAARGPAPQAPPGGSPFLATSQVTAGSTWAIAVMGGSVASHDNFWQLFERPAGSSRWKLVTPPGVPDNGGLVLANAGTHSVITAFRPSQYLTFTPLTVTGDGGRAWTPAGPLDAALADSPGALAAAPATGRLLALTMSGAALVAPPGYTRWSTLTTQRALAATHAGRRCGLRGLTAVTFRPSGTPLLAGGCSRQGTAGIFAPQGATWQAAGPILAGPLAGQRIAVLRLAPTSAGTVALLQAGTGPAASLLAAWLAGGSSSWVLSAPLRLGGARLTSASFGPAGAMAVVLNGSRARTITGEGSSWQSLPALPAGTAALAAGAAGGFDALAVHRTRLTVWQLTAGSATWRTSQVMTVPVQFGSSG